MPNDIPKVPSFSEKRHVFRPSPTFLKVLMRGRGRANRKSLPLCLVPLSSQDGTGANAYIGLEKGAGLKKRALKI